jgi:hypothetical protein
VRRELGIFCLLAQGAFSYTDSTPCLVFELPRLIGGETPGDQSTTGARTGQIATKPQGLPTHQGNWAFSPESPTRSIASTRAMNWGEKLGPLPSLIHLFVPPTHPFSSREMV